MVIYMNIFKITKILYVTTRSKKMMTLNKTDVRY